MSCMMLISDFQCIRHAWFVEFFDKNYCLLMAFHSLPHFHTKKFVTESAVLFSTCFSIFHDDFFSLQYDSDRESCLEESFIIF